MEAIERIKDLIAIKGLKQIDISNELGINRSDISKFLAGKKIDFYNVFILTKHLDPIGYLDILDSYCKSFNTPVGIQNALEYASNHNRTALMEYLLETHSDRKDAIREWISVYSLHSSFKSMESHIVIQQCRELYGNVNAPELKIKLDLIEAAINYQNRKHLMYEISKRLQGRIEELKKGFIKESFKVRLCSYLAPAVLYVNEDVETAKMLSEEVIKNPVSPSHLIAASYHTMSHAFLFNSVDLSVDYLERAIRLYMSEGNDKRAKILRSNDLAFAKSFHNLTFEVHDLTDEELAHQLIVRGETDRAISILESKKELDSFGKLYLGIAKNDFTLLLESHGMMARTGNNFFLKIFENKLAQIINGKGVLS